MLWKIKPLVVVVYKNGKLFGTEVQIFDYMDEKHSMTIFKNFEAIGKEHLLQLLQKEVDRGVIFSIATLTLSLLLFFSVNLLI